MRAISWVLGGLAAVTAVGLIVPATRFAPRNHVDLLAGRWFNTFTDVVPADIVPNFRITRTDRSPRRELLAGLDRGVQGRRQDLTSLVEQVFDSPFGWAANISNELRDLTLDTPRDIETVRSRPAERTARRKKRFEAVRASALRGAALDPDNAFFPLALAVAEQGLGRLAERDAAIVKAATCSRYESYVGTLRTWRQEAALTDFGTRGRAVDLGDSMTYSDAVLFSLRQLGANAALGSAETRIDLLRAVRTVYLSVKDASELQRVSFGIYTIFPVPSSLPAKDRPKTDQERVAALLSRVHECADMRSQVDPNALGFDPVAFVEETTHVRTFSLTHPTLDGWPDERDPPLTRWLDEHAFGEGTFGAAVAISVMLASLLLLAIALGLSKLPESWRLGPCGPLAAATAWTAYDARWTWNASGAEALPWIAGCYALLTAMALFERTRKLALVFGFIMPVAFILGRPELVFENGGPYPAIPLIVYTLFVFRARWLHRFGPPERLSWPLLIGLCLCIYGVGSSFAISRIESPPVWFMFGWDAALFLALAAVAILAWQNASIPEAARLVAGAAPWLLALSWVAYLGLWAFDVRENARFARVFEHARYGAPVVRAWAKSHARLEGLESGVRR